MSDYNINKMDFKQLRNEVQLLRDELAIMKRKYEDIIYNLDTDNFSSRFVKEQGDMKTAIEVTAEGIKTKVSKEDLDNTLSEYSTIEQTAEQIKSTVTKEFVVDQLDGEIVTNATLTSKVNQAADEINLSVSKTYETKDNAANEYNNLYDSISSVSIKSDRISTRVGSLENGQYGSYTLFTQSADTFLFDGDKAVFTGCIYLTDNNNNKAFSIFLNEGDYDSFHIWGYGNYYGTPVIIGSEVGDGVYIGNYSDNNRIATREWVLEQLS